MNLGWKIIGWIVAIFLIVIIFCDSNHLIKVEELIDLGQIAPPFACTGEISVTNYSPKSIPVSQLAAACGCIKFEKSPMWLQPFSTLKIPFSFDGSTRNRGVWESRVILKFTGASREVKILADLSRMIDVTPQHWVLFPDSLTSQRFQISGKDISKAVILQKPDYVDVSGFDYVSNSNVNFQCTIKTDCPTEFQDLLKFRIFTRRDEILTTVKISGIR